MKRLALNPKETIPLDTGNVAPPPTRTDVEGKSEGNQKLVEIQLLQSKNRFDRAKSWC